MGTHFYAFKNGEAGRRTSPAEKEKFALRHIEVSHRHIAAGSHVSWPVGEPRGHWRARLCEPGPHIHYRMWPARRQSRLREKSQAPHHGK